MKDPYLYDDIAVLKNKGNIKDTEKLREAEANVTKYSMTVIYEQNFKKFNTSTISLINQIIFGDLFEWAGDFRTIQISKAESVLGGDTVKYAHPNQIKKELDEISKEIAKLKKGDDKRELMFKIVRITARLWQIHPFREGNTRTIISFAILLAKHLETELNYALFEKHAAYVRNSCVWATQGIYSKFEYLENIFYNAAGLLNETKEVADAPIKDYTIVNGYYIADYKETPHTYIDETK